MTREDANKILYELINSGILDEELEAKLVEITKHICADDFEKCVGTEYCDGCEFLKEQD